MRESLHYQKHDVSTYSQPSSLMTTDHRLPQPTGSRS